MDPSPFFHTSTHLNASAQSVGFALTAAGFILGHSHGGRAFPASAHGKLANIMLVPMIAQFVLGVYLKLHIHEETIRPYFVKAHGILGKSYPIWGWVQMLFGAIVLRGYCRGGNLNQCLAHYIMVCMLHGSGDAFHGFILNRRGAGSLPMPLSWPLSYWSARTGSGEAGAVQIYGILRSSWFGCVVWIALLRELALTSLPSGRESVRT